ncbi:MAG: DUF2510 domain-containing protein [Actinomycetota bacterium]|nr:DUF2510 domain-containing protein [Actinomycetota bacterium]
MTTASWQPDPMHRHEYRWWDGQAWTEHVNDSGVAGVDPLGMASTAPTQAMPMQPMSMQPGPELPMAVQPPTQPQPPIGAQAYQPPVASQVWGTPGADVQHPTIAPPGGIPTGTVLATYGADPASSGPNRKTGMIVGAVVAVVALGAGAFFLLGGDDDNSTVAGTSTSAPGSSVETSTSSGNGTATSVVASTQSPTTVVATTVPRTTTPVTTPGVDGDALVAAMPAAADAPADWSFYSEPDPAPAAEADGGFCMAGNNTYRAQEVGSLADAYGPSWDLPSSGWFGVDAYAFANDAAADEFLTATEAQANGCMTESPQGTVPEAEAEWFDDGYGDDAVWSWVKNSAAYPEATPIADALVRTVSDEFYVTNYGGFDYGVTYTSFARFERFGNIVLVFWLDGSHDYNGFDGEPDWAYTPTDADLDASAAVVRPAILQRLAQAGLV